jgi:uncharacterized protein (UPF0210 family)
MSKCALLFLSFALSIFLHAQPPSFRIRTITTGITLTNLFDTARFKEAISFLQAAKKTFVAEGYEVQTLRVATSNLYTYLNKSSLNEALPFLQQFDAIARRNGVILSVGQVLVPNYYQSGVGDWAVQLVKTTRSISFSLPISSHALGIHSNSIRVASEVIVALSREDNGEANFRFTASANCPAGIPFFPAAFHEGVNSFAVGLESAGLLTEAFLKADKNNARQVLKEHLEKNLKPVEAIAEKIAGVSKWQYDGIDVSPAPGLNASIGKAIETYTQQPFGAPSTLGACALITDVLKSLEVKRCGYSGLMLPVIEDSVLAARAEEQRFTIEELLLFSSVSGTGLDVVPIAGDTPKEVIEAILTDVAALSLKYTAKALSARLFPIPGKKAGDSVNFTNPNLTSTVVMPIH